MKVKMFSAKQHLLALLPYFLPAATTIVNPIIPGSNADPAIIRLGHEYFIATTSLEFYPGLPIYKSIDLQNWDLFSHALTRPSQVQLYGTPTSAGTCHNNLLGSDTE
jgi:beta-xylosidase